ncbi:50S ribosomal protein L9 [bacterium BMS3Bbin12]|nr:50S ribosomal protein L9 [bacterium BMS3Abin12]GBE48636.1 50S ribosomal protein L9 [bacterium BMS3Bbin12]GBE51441.1 50S ribosomal protein L9 [bacterium BMS3Bbin13]HDJ86928.1 50S ribosomal protein L9 [Chromatiales bacterium]HDK02939.1 50S ribosomal protein L9 [Gammaproteobacteria bacterium]
MEVILLQKTEHLGDLGDRVNVRRGFARNFLIPKGRATEATPANVARFEARRVELERLATGALGAAEARREQLEGLTITIPSKAGDEGRLFGSIGTAEIAEAISEQGVAVERREVRLPAGPMHQTGEFEVTLHLHMDVNTVVKIAIVAE